MAVEKLNSYLSRFGYFPNEDLAARHQEWRSVVTAAPKSIDTFDANTELAVRRLQKMAKLPETGVVDDRTWKLIGTPRCGNPDAAPEGNGDEKWAIYSTTNKWNRTSITWKLTNTDDLSRAHSEAAISSAFSSWARETDLSFVKTTGAADIVIQFKAIDGAGDVLARAYSPNDGGDVEVDTAETWTFSRLTATLLHELGHSLGIAHSSVGSNAAVMYPYENGLSYLLADDEIAISALYDVWDRQPGCAKDIGSAPNQTSTWVVGCQADGAAGNYTLHRWNGSAWVRYNGNAARIGVDANGTPWVAQADGDIYRLKSDNTWEKLPGCAKDITGAGPASAWAIGCTSTPGGYTIHNWNGSNWNVVGGSAVAIAMGPNNRAWAVNSDNQIFRRFANNSGWELMPGAATDIGANVNSVWIIGTDGSVHVWDEQAEIKYDDGRVAAPARRQWVKTAGTAKRVAADQFGPWVVTSAGNIYKHLK
jgi:hypothetical protein